MFAADGPDISGLSQPGFDWAAAAGCTTRRFASARISHGPYTGSDGQVHNGFIDSQATPNRAGMLTAEFLRRIWYTIITPLASAEDQAAQVRRWVDLNGGLPPGEAIAIDWEDNPNNPGEAAGLDLVLAMHSSLAAVYGADRVGFYGSRGYLDQLPDARGFRWLASYTTDARTAALERGCVAVQWTSSFECDGWGGRLDMNEVVDQAALDRACAIASTNYPPLHPPEVIVVAPQGACDLVELVLNETGGWTGSVRVSGWAYDPDGIGPTKVPIYIGGILAGTATADRERSDVNAALGITGDHGYDVIVVVPRVTIHVQAYAADNDGTNVAIGARNVDYDIPTTATPPVDPEPPVDPQPPAQPVDDAHIESIARTVARDEISKAHLTPGA